VSRGNCSRGTCEGNLLGPELWLNLFHNFLELIKVRRSAIIWRLGEAVKGGDRFRVSVSSFEFLVLGFRFWVSGFWFLVLVISNLKFEISDFKPKTLKPKPRNPKPKLHTYTFPPGFRAG